MKLFSLPVMLPCKSTSSLVTVEYQVVLVDDDNDGMLVWFDETALVVVVVRRNVVPVSSNWCHHNHESDSAIMAHNYIERMPIVVF